MKKELKLRNAIYSSFAVGIFFSCCVVFICTFGIVLTYFAEEARDFTMVLTIGGAVIAGIWIITLTSMLFCKTIIVTDEEFKVYRWKKLKWSVRKENILECIYTKPAWYKFLFPMETLNMYSFQFDTEDEGISPRHYLVLSYKQVKKIQENFDYNIRIIGSINEQ